MTRFWLGCMFVGAVGFVVAVSGCASTTTGTLKAEDALAVLTSQVAHAVDGADALLETATRSQLASDPAGAKSYFASYKPAIEKARLAVHTSQDVITDAEAVRSRIPSSAGGTCATGCTGASADFTAWLPALEKALASLEQVYSDIKGLVQK